MLFRSGVLVVALWVVCAAAAWRMRHRSLLTLHAVLASVVLLEVLSMARIFGKVWYYLTLWAWAVTVAVVLACMATLWCWWERRNAAHADRASRWLVGVGGLVAAACTAVSVGGAVHAQVPEHRLSEALGQLVDPTVKAEIGRAHV